MPRSDNAGAELVYPRAIAARLADAEDAMRDASRKRRMLAAGLPPIRTTGLRPASDRAKLRNGGKPKSTPPAQAVSNFRIPIRPSATPAAAATSSDAARPAKKRKMDVELDGVPTSALQTDAPLMMNVGLPTKLGRPAWKDISREAKLSLHPGLADCPTNYIRDKLLTTGLAEAMRKVCATVEAVSPIGNTLPQDLSVVVRDLTSDLPSHMIAVYGTKHTDEPRQRVTLFPMHNMILASHCANLPPLQPSAPEREDCEEFDEAASRARLTIPVVPLCLPHPESFPHISAYLYSKKTEPLMAALIPPPPAAPAKEDSSDEEDEEEESDGEQDVNPRVRLARRLAKAYDPRTLLARAMYINGVWRNTCALGIFDEKFWMSLDVAWEVILHALRLATSAAGTTTKEVMTEMAEAAKS